MNIYFDSNYSTTASLPNSGSFQSITTNGLKIPSASTGDVLFIDSNKDVDGVQIGPTGYVLQSDGTLPQWTNTLNINQIRSTSYKIPGTTRGDLFTVDTINTLERVPIGPSGSILTSTGTQFQWQSLTLPNPLTIQNLTITSGGAFIINGLTNGPLFLKSGQVYSELNQSYFNAGTVNNVTTTSSTIFSTTFNLVNGTKYKISLSANLVAASSTGFTFHVGGSAVITQTLESTNNLTRIFIYTALSTGAVIFALTGLTSSGTSTLSNINLLCEYFQQ